MGRDEGRAPWSAFMRGTSPSLRRVAASRKARSLARDARPWLPRIATPIMGSSGPRMAASLSSLQAALAGRYTIERELGRGGMATVYVAHDRKHHRRVAIKILKPELTAALGPERFLREIEIAA